VEIYERIEARLIELEKRHGDLEHQLEALEALIKQVDALERRVIDLASNAWRSRV